MTTTEPALHPHALSDPIRVAIEAGGVMQPAWIHRVVADIEDSKIATVVLVLLTDDREPASAAVPAGAGSSAILYGLYTALDRKVFGSGAPGSTPRIRARGESVMVDACAPVDLRQTLPGVQCVTRGPGEDMARIAPFEVDVTLRLGGRRLGAGDIARHATLSFHHGAGSYGEGPPGFWEVMERAPVTTSSLQLWDEEGGRSVDVCRAASSTDNFSVTRNQNGHLWTCSAFVLRYLKALHEGRAPSPESLRREQPILPYGGRRRGVPGNTEMLRLLSRHALRVGVDRVKHVLYPGRWVLAYSLGDQARPLHDFDILVPPEGYLWADPFPVLFEGRYFVFLEEQYSAGSPGHISVISLQDDGSWTEPTKVIGADYHLSYPCIFRWDDCFYMIPESGEARRIELYRCTDFPTGWEFDRVLVEGIRGVDTTVAEVDGRWWMFVNTGEEGARNCEELSLFSSPAPTGPWVPHAANPVNSDARSSRPAGHIIRWHGRLLRPSQDSGGRYGRAVVVNEVLCLDEERFDEKEVFRIEADWDRSVDRIHSLHLVDGLTVVDLLIRERRGIRRASAGTS
jgi:hypothetical protein